MNSSEVEPLRNCADLWAALDQIAAPHRALAAAVEEVVAPYRELSAAAERALAPLRAVIALTSTFQSHTVSLDQMRTLFEHLARSSASLIEISRSVGKETRHESRVERSED